MIAKVLMIASLLAFVGCEEPPPRTAEEAAIQIQNDIKTNLGIPIVATDVVLLPGETQWATYTLTIDGKRRRFLHYRLFGDSAAMGLTELNP